MWGKDKELPPTTAAVYCSFTWYLNSWWTAGGERSNQTFYSNRRSNASQYGGNFTPLLFQAKCMFVKLKWQKKQSRNELLNQNKLFKVTFILFSNWYSFFFYLFIFFYFFGITVSPGVPPKENDHNVKKLNITIRFCYNHIQGQVIFMLALRTHFSFLYTCNNKTCICGVAASGCTGEWSIFVF